MDDFRPRMYAVTEPGDERSRQLRYALESRTPTTMQWCGLDGEEQSVWCRVVECRDYEHEGVTGLEEWVMEPIGE